MGNTMCKMTFPHVSGNPTLLHVEYGTPWDLLKFVESERVSPYIELDYWGKETVKIFRKGGRLEMCREPY